MRERDIYGNEIYPKWQTALAAIVAVAFWGAVIVGAYLFLGGGPAAGPPTPNATQLAQPAPTPTPDCQTYSNEPIAGDHPSAPTPRELCWQAREDRYYPTYRAEGGGIEDFDDGGGGGGRGFGD